MADSWEGFLEEATAKKAVLRRLRSRAEWCKWELEAEGALGRSL